MSEVDLVVKQGSTLMPYEIKWGKKKGKCIAFQNEYGFPVQTISSDKPSSWPFP